MKDKRICSYRITNELLGTGSYSEVYLGYTNKQEKVAVKIIPRQKINQKQINVFESQIKLLGNCKSQHIINLIDVKKTKTNFYIFLQFCENGNLAQYIKQKQTINQPQSIKIFSQIIKGMNAMRKANIFHRDLKPDNIMFKGDTIKIVDFGLARQYSNGEMFKSYAGTPLYMAPQILKRQPYNEKADVYSAGAILYQMLFGIHPYRQNDLPSLIKKIQGKSFNKSNKVHISNDLRELLLKMLQPNPEKRIDFTQLMMQLQKYDIKKIETKFNNFKKTTTSTIPYISIMGGICSLYKFDFCSIKQKSIYDMDIKLCGKISQKLIFNELEWLSNIDLIRV